MEGYSDVYDGSSMLFMDFRRHHSGVWAGTAPRCRFLCCACGACVYGLRHRVRAIIMIQSTPVLYLPCPALRRHVV